MGFESPFVDMATGPTVDAFGVVGNTIGAGRELREGHYAEGGRKGAEALGGEFKLVHGIYGDEATEHIASGFESMTSFADMTEHLSKTKDRPGQKRDPKDKRSSVDRKMDETVLGTADAVKTVGNVASMFGGGEVKAVTDVGAKALKLGNRGVQMSRTLGWHGKDKDGNNRGLDDDVVDKGTAMHDHVHDMVHDKLGDGMASDLVSHAAGGATMLSELPGAAGEAAALGVAGYAVDAYDKAAETAGTVKSFVTNPKVQELAAKMYMGMF